VTAVAGVVAVDACREDTVQHGRAPGCSSRSARSYPALLHRGLDAASTSPRARLGVRSYAGGAPQFQRDAVRAPV